MPRQFNYDNLGQGYDHFDTFDDPIIGKRELEDFIEWKAMRPHQIWPPRTQFTGHIYDNKKAFEIFEWIEDNCNGKWFWFEHITNHGHAINTDLWFECPQDITAFRLAWGETLVYQPWSLADLKSKIHKCSIHERSCVDQIIES